MNWKRINRRECPVCNGDRSDCRQNLETNLIHCRSVDANPLDYIYRGQDVWGFGMWAYKPDADQWTDDRREEWQREHELKKQQREKENKESLKKLLPIKERDQEIRSILSQLTLSDRHKEILKGRGLTDSLIDLSGYRSVKQWQKLDQAVNNRLSGVKIDGLSLINHTDGILIPIPNEDGLYTHLRVNDLTPDTKNKYYPLSSAKRGVKFHLANGEQPIAVYLPDNAPVSNRIGFTEGLEYKPLLTSNKLGIPVIGASGGNFASSREAVEKAIATIQARYGWDAVELVLYADAGSIINSNVTNNYQKLGEFIPNLKIADWGQLTDKKALDIDEIDLDSTEINLISIDEFSEVAKVEQYRQKCHQSWVNMKKFTPTQTINQEYLDLPFPEVNSTIFINSGLGSGKTTLCINWLGYKDNNGVWHEGLCSLFQGAISLGYRNTLLIQFCEKSGFLHIKDVDNWVDISDPSARVAACVDSHFKFKPDDFDGKVLILDEVVSIIKHLLFSETVKNRGDAIKLFSQAIKRSKSLVCFDGNLSDPYCDFIAKLDPSKKVVKILNTHSKKKPELILLEGTIKDENLRKRDHSPWLHDLLNTPDMVAAVASDSQILLESLDEIYQEQGLSTLRVDSKTINDKKVKEFLKNPKEWLEKNAIDRLLISPSCESGLDVNIDNYFTHFFGLFFGKLDSDSISQMIARIRDSEVTRYLWVTPFTKQDNPDSIKSPLVESFAFNYAQRLTRDLHSSMDGELTLISELLSLIVEAQLLPENKLSQRLESMIYHEKTNLRKCVYWRLEQQGYDTSNRVAPEIDGKFSGAKKEVSEEKTEVKKRNSKDIFKANDKYIGIPETRLNFDASWEDRCALMKAKIVDKLPGINKIPLWSEDFIYAIKYASPNIINQLEDRYLLENLDKSKDRSQRIYHSQLVKARKGQKLTPWKLSPRHQRLVALESIGLSEFISGNSGVEFTSDSPAATELLSKCQIKKHWQALGKKPHSNPIKYLRWLLEQLGYGLTSRRVRENGKDIYLYKIQSIPDPKIAPFIEPILDAIATRYSQDKPILDWSEGVQTQETVQETDDQVFSDQNAENPHHESIKQRPRVDNSLLEKNQLVVTESSKYTDGNTMDIIHPIVGIEDTPPDAIAHDLTLIDNVDGLRWLVCDTGLTKAQRQKAWELLSEVEKRRLTPIFDELKKTG